MKTKLLCATALVLSSFTPAMMTPAFALPSQIVQDAAQQVCTDSLKPNERSGFKSTAVFVNELENTVDIGSPHSFYDYVGIGEPIYEGGYPGSVLTAHRNGKSPNLHNWTTPETVRWLDSSYKGIQDTQTTTTYYFDCVVSKKPGGRDDEIFPPGLQGQSLIDANIVNGSRIVEFASGGGALGPLPTNGSAPQVEMVVCISPNGGTKGRPGEWRVMNGASGSAADCATRSNELGGADLPNENAPTS
jgi:hypothetical protein